MFFGSNIPVSYALCFLCVSVCVCIGLSLRNNRTRARLKLNWNGLQPRLAVKSNELTVLSTVSAVSWATVNVQVHNCSTVVPWMSPAAAEAVLWLDFPARLSFRLLGQAHAAYARFTCLDSDNGEAHIKQGYRPMRTSDRSSNNKRLKAQTWQLVHSKLLTSPSTNNRYQCQCVCIWESVSLWVCVCVCKGL